MSEPEPKKKRGGHKRPGLWKNDPARQPLGDKLRPWQPGHLESATHGATSSRLVEPVARELVEQALANVPYLADVAYRPALEAWAVAEAKCRLLDAWLQRVGVLDDTGQPRHALDELRRWEKRASDERARLGLDPLSRAKLGRDSAAAEATLRAIYERLEAEDGTDG